MSMYSIFYMDGWMAKHKYEPTLHQLEHSMPVYARGGLLLLSDLNVEKSQRLTLNL
jgi:hypothetical protein